MLHDTRYEELDHLSDYELEHSEQDIRGLPLVSPTGQRYGVIEDLLVDDNRTHVEAVRLDNGKVCAVEPLEIHDNAVVYGERARAFAERSGGAATEEVVPVVEEKVAIGKRVADHGKNITVSSRVVEDRVSEDVHLRDETVSVDKRPVNRELATGDADDLLRDRTVSMTERSEEPVVGKKAVVTDEVVVKKTAADRVERVDETARRTEVDVDVDDDTTTRRR